MKRLALGMMLLGLCLFCTGCAGLGAGRTEPGRKSWFEFDPIGDTIDGWYDSRKVKHYKQEGYTDERARQRVFEDNFFDGNNGRPF